MSWYRLKIMLAGEFETEEQFVEAVRNTLKVLDALERPVGLRWQGMAMKELTPAGKELPLHVEGILD